MITIVVYCVFFGCCESRCDMLVEVVMDVDVFLGRRGSRCDRGSYCEVINISRAADLALTSIDDYEEYSSYIVRRLGTLMP